VAAASFIVLRIADIAALPDLCATLAAGQEGARNEVAWVSAIDLADPASAVERGELALVSGTGWGQLDDERAADLVLRLAAAGAAGLAVADADAPAEPVPAAVQATCDAHRFPLLRLGRSVPAATRTLYPALAVEPVSQAHAVHEQLMEEVLGGAEPRDLLAVLVGELDASLQLVDGDEVLAEQHGRVKLAFDDALQLPVGPGGSPAILRAARDATPPFDAVGELILRHGQNALALVLARRKAVLATELRLAGTFLDDLEHERVDLGETTRRLVAFGLNPQHTHMALIAVLGVGQTPEQLRAAIAHLLSRHGMPHVAEARDDGVAFLVDAPTEDALMALADTIAKTGPRTRVAVGRPSSGAGLGRMLLETRAALGACTGDVVSYRDLSSFELLLSIPVPALQAYVDRILGPAAHNGWLVETLSVLLESGCVWKDAAAQLDVHRHTLRYRMDRLEEQTGRHPDRPENRLELWLAVKAIQVIEMRGGRAFEAHTDQV
jgi:purine catabolism regulator